MNYKGIYFPKKYREWSLPAGLECISDAEFKMYHAISEVQAEKKEQRAKEGIKAA